MRMFFLSACVFIVLAIVGDFAAKSRAAAAATKVAKADKSKRDSEHQQDIELSNIFQLASYAMATIAVVCWAASAIRKERCYHPLLLLLLMIFLLLHFIAV